MGAHAQNLTGVWQGLYTYPNGESASFVATLIDSSGALSGSTHEPCARAVSSSGTLYATLAGSRSGSAVAFHKVYDGKVPHYHAVDYTGTLNADATEVEGRWVIRGVWSGKFLMIRPARKEESVERKAHNAREGSLPLETTPCRKRKANAQCYNGGQTDRLAASWPLSNCPYRRDDHRS